MPATVKPWLDGLTRLKRASLEGAAQGVDGACTALTADLRASAPHGDDTGATQASYNVRRVGMGEYGDGAFAAAQAAVEQLNPGHSASAPVSISGPLGAIADSGTDYQIYLETENAGTYATLGPFVPTMARTLTQAAADGSKRGLR